MAKDLLEMIAGRGVDPAMEKELSRTYTVTTKSDPVAAMISALSYQTQLMKNEIEVPEGKKPRVWAYKKGGRYYTQIGSIYKLDIGGKNIFLCGDTENDVADFFGMVIELIKTNKDIQKQIIKKSKDVGAKLVAGRDAAKKAAEDALRAAADQE